MDEQEPSGTTSVDSAQTRRRVLRRAAAGLAGAGAAAAIGSPAAAGVGGPVVLGDTNNPVGEKTTLTASGPDASLALVNPAGPTLRLAPPSLPKAGYSRLFLDIGPELRLTLDSLQFSQFYDDTWAAMAVAIAPTRILDTRTAEGRAHIIAGGSAIDGRGRLSSGGVLVVDLTGLVFFAEGVRANVTVADTSGPGFLTVWGKHSQPKTSSLNWYGAGQILSNGVLAQTGSYTSGTTEYGAVVAIAASKPAAVIMDVSAFIVPGPWYLKSYVEPSGAAAAGRAAPARVPRPLPGTAALVLPVAAETPSTRPSVR